MELFKEVRTILMRDIADLYVDILGAITTRDESGQHFTEVYSAEDLTALENAGLIEIVHPVHPTGIKYEQKYWSVGLTQAGQDYLDSRAKVATHYRYGNTPWPDFVLCPPN